MVFLSKNVRDVQLQLTIIVLGHDDLDAMLSSLW